MSASKNVDVIAKSEKATSHENEEVLNSNEWMEKESLLPVSKM